MGRYLTILEVSQKQAYIFGSNKLKDNIMNSAVIAKVLSPAYLEEVLKEKTDYTDKDNMVYSGGGHTFLEFPNKEMAVQCVGILTENIYRNFDGLEVFVKTIEYDEDLSHEGKSPEKNLKNLSEKLEKKKAIRAAAFHQGSYGIEKIDAATLNTRNSSGLTEAQKAVLEQEIKSEKKRYPGYQPVEAFEELGGSEGDSNFIAVVHIDGNGMGYRVAEVYKNLVGKDWTEVKANLRAFSEGIDEDYKAAYREMTESVAEQLREGQLNKLNLRGNKFPIRRIITAGDDICFVTEGRIGLECASLFIQKLKQKGYSACAGVAIVHLKYPFYKAYELAELLCSNAKKYNAGISPEDNGRGISSIDWHIEFGEIKDTLKEIRMSYETMDGNRLELRPYIVDAPESLFKENPCLEYRKYQNFRKVMEILQKKKTEYPNGKIKELRGVLKKGEIAARHYLKFNRMEAILPETKMNSIQESDMRKIGAGITTDTEIFVTQKGGEKHSILFDGIELIDTFLLFQEGSAEGK